MAGRSEKVLPTIENPFAEGSAAEQLYELFARAERGESAAELAARIDRDPETVRETLESFAALGIVTERAGSPPTYERNDAHFPRDAASVLAGERSLEALEARMDALVDRVWTYQRRYDAETPIGADASAVEVTAAALADWEAARAELRCCERARRIRLREMAAATGSEEEP